MSEIQTVELPKMTKETFITILRENVKRDGVEDLIAFLDDGGFFESPASTKYHGSYEGGLFHHSLNVYYNLIDQLTMFYGNEWEKVYSKESVTLVSLLHDVCKMGKYIEGTRNQKNPETGKWEMVDCFLYNPDADRMGHGPGSVYMISDYIKLTTIEKQAIHFHMGAFDLSQYNSLDDLGTTFSKNTLAFALHMADMTATYIDENKNFKSVEQIEFEKN